MTTDAGGEDAETPRPAPGRRRAGQPPIWKLFVGGFIGTQALALILFVLEPNFISRTREIPQALRTELSEPHGLGLVLLHVFNGSIVFPLAFGLMAMRVRGPWMLKGLVWGAILWLLAGAVIMPMSGFGYFGYDADGWRVAVSSLAGHLAYGAILGLFAGIPGREAD